MRFIRLAQRVTVGVAILVALQLNGSDLHLTSAAPMRAGSIQMMLATSELVVGNNRFTFGVIDNNHPINVNSARLTFYELKGNRATVSQVMTAHFNWFSKNLRDTDSNSAAIELGGVYVAHPTFKHAGNWGVDAQLRIHGHVQSIQTQFMVRNKGLSPAIGTRAPRSNNPTVRQMPARLLDSGRPPDDMHALSIAQAIKQHKPLVVLFATAAYCTSRMCGPEIQIVQQAERHFRGKVNFVHIEVYYKANPKYGIAPTFLQWHLTTEPWIFVVNRHGIITDKFEGPTAYNEIAQAVQKNVSGP